MAENTTRSPQLEEIHTGRFVSPCIMYMRNFPTLLWLKSSRPRMSKLLIQDISSTCLLLYNHFHYFIAALKLQNQIRCQRIQRGSIFVLVGLRRGNVGHKNYMIHIKDTSKVRFSHSKNQIYSFSLCCVSSNCNMQFDFFSNSA